MMRLKLGTLFLQNPCDISQGFISNQSFCYKPRTQPKTVFKKSYILRIVMLEWDFLVTLEKLFKTNEICGVQPV